MKNDQLLHFAENKSALQDLSGQKVPELECILGASQLFRAVCVFHGSVHDWGCNVLGCTSVPAMDHLSRHSSREDLLLFTEVQAVNSKVAPD